MDSRLFELKNIRTDESGQEYLDLTQHTFIYRYSSSIKSVYRVEQDTVMRPDLISYKFFGTDKYADAICKVNGIYNPFSIEEGKVLVIPNITDGSDNYKKPSDIEFNNELDVNANEIRSQFVDEARLSKKDKSRLERLTNKSKKLKNPTTPLPPNMKNNNKPNITKSDSSITLGNK
jgi:hypothetical protein